MVLGERTMVYRVGLAHWSYQLDRSTYAGPDLNWEGKDCSLSSSVLHDSGHSTWFI